MKKYKKVKLLILDEWLLYSLNENEARYLLELVEARSRVSSTIHCSQFDIPGWHAHLYDATLADAIVDRIIHNAHMIRVEGDSMRKRKGLTE
jgi:DNA replication protein DnaC